MCGIAGFWSLNHASPDPRAALAQMTSKLIHRGPDADGSWVSPDGRLALGHRRLSIQDLTTAGAQPMQSDCGRFVLNFNGEIYNFHDLRAELTQVGAKQSWAGHSDTEVLLAAIVHWGLQEAVKRATGMFAFALWDGKLESLTLARDRIGEKPLYYTVSAGTLLFASELKAIEAWPSFSRTPDLPSLALYLRYGFLPSPLTPYGNTFKVVPGTCLTISIKDGTFSQSEHAFWSVRNDLARQPRSLRSLAEARDDLQKQLETTISQQMLADVPVGAFLSGGLDSSLIVSIMRNVSSSTVKTFTVGFEDPAFDESAYAREVARLLGTEHTEVHLNTRDILSFVPTVPELYDEPFGDPSQVPTALICSVARKHVKVCLSGDGSDELFGGYNHYRWGQTLQFLDHVMHPAALRALGKLCAPLARTFSSKRLLRFSELMSAAMAGLDNDFLFNAAFPNVRRVSAHALPPDPIALRVAHSSAKGVERLMEIDMYGFLPDDILMKVDRAAMGVGLETRVPFLDHRVAQLAWTLPMNYRTTRNRGKIVIRGLLAKYLPARLFDRPKQGFGIPLAEWLRGPLRSWAEDLLFSRSHLPGLLNDDAVLDYWRAHQSGKVDRQRELWTLISLRNWLRRL